MRPPEMDERANPRTAYQQRLSDLSGALQVLEARDTRFVTLRIILFLMTAAGAALSLGLTALPPVIVIPPILAFLVAALLHSAVRRRIDPLRLAIDHYTRGLARLENEWPGTGIQTTACMPRQHPYAADLDVFGSGSLFELLCTTRTRIGAGRLAEWLCEPAGVGEIADRHAAIEDLRGRIDFREELARLGGGERLEVDADTLTGWSAAPPHLRGSDGIWMHLLAWALPATVVVGLLLWSAELTNSLPFWLAILAELGARNVFGRQTARITAAIDATGRELRVLSLVLSRLEREEVSAPRLLAIRGMLVGGGMTASRSIRRLDRLTRWLNSRRNMMFAPFAYLLMWEFHFALAIEGWRLRSGSAISGWVHALGEYEALSALAGYAFEHPDDPFPELVGEGPIFEGFEIGHPLLADDRCVRNDVRLDPECPLWVVSGSNMSGKSTLLRTVGVNAVLAFSGAPVRAARLRISPLAVGASIRIQDSLQEGVSHFYAEIRRLRALSDLAGGEPPLLFLLDDMLHGTNSHDRSIGADAVVRSLVSLGAIGLVTTHDLSLTEAATAMGPRARNVHFVDRLEGEQLVFDYRLREGVVEKSNAIELMRRVGLRI